MVFLSVPAEDYRDSYLEALGEFQQEGRHKHIVFDEVASNFGSFVQHIQQKTDRSRLRPEQVPHSEFWLIEENDYLGELFLRYELNESLLQIGGHIGYAIRPTRRRQGYGKLILKYGLEQARMKGLQRVLITCNEDNYGSRAIIETNGGILENVISVAGWPALVRRYWVDL